MPADQFGANPNSRPVPTAPPQRVSVARSNTTPGFKPSYLSLVTAAPPFTYQRTLFQAYPTWPVNKPSASILDRLTNGARMALVFDPRKLAQSPWASTPNTHALLCQR